MTKPPRLYRLPLELLLARVLAGAFPVLGRIKVSSTALKCFYAPVINRKNVAGVGAGWGYAERARRPRTRRPPARLATDRTVIFLRAALLHTSMDNPE
jgi:hypothetical protein